jgi:hypothetical protein
MMRTGAGLHCNRGWCEVLHRIGELCAADATDAEAIFEAALRPVMLRPSKERRLTGYSITASCARPPDLPAYRVDQSCAGIARRIWCCSAQGRPALPSARQRQLCSVSFSAARVAPKSAYRSRTIDKARVRTSGGRRLLLGLPRRFDSKLVAPSCLRPRSRRNTCRRCSPIGSHASATRRPPD